MSSGPTPVCIDPDPILLALERGTFTRGDYASGCRHHDDCLNCPFAECLYVDDGSGRSAQARLRDGRLDQALALLDAGVPLDLVAYRTRLSAVTIRRYRHDAQHAA